MRKYMLIAAVMILYIPVYVAGQVDKNDKKSNLTGENIAAIPEEILNKLKQKNSVLTFEECAAIAINTSFSIKDSEFELKQQNFNYTAESRVDLDMTLPEFIQEKQEHFSVDSTGAGSYEFYSVQTNEQNSNITFTQPLPTNGKIYGNIVANRLSQKDETPLYTNRISLNFDQPFFTANSRQMKIYQSKLELEKAKISYIQQRVELIYGYGFFSRSESSSDYGSLMRMFGRMGRRGRSRGSLSTYYYSMYHTSRLLEIEQLHYDILNELVSVAEEKMNAGKLPEGEYLKIKVELSSSNDRLYSARTQFAQAKRQLIQFLGIDPDSDFEVVEDIPFKPIVINLEKAIAEGIANNTGIRDYKIDIEIDSLAILFEKSRTEITSTGEERLSEFKGNISSSLGLNKTDEYYRLYYDDFDRSQAFKLSLSAPVWDWGRKRMLVRAKEIELEQQKRHLKNDMIDTRRQVISYTYTIEMMQERLELITRARNIAELGLNIARQQFKNETLSVEDLILSIKKDYEARNEYLSLIINYKNTLIRLANQTQWDFEKNKSIRSEIEQIIKKII